MCEKISGIVAEMSGHGNQHNIKGTHGEGAKGPPGASAITRLREECRNRAGYPGLIQAIKEIKSYLYGEDAAHQIKKPCP
jgi:hypothetical protein